MPITPADGHDAPACCLGASPGGQNLRTTPFTSARHYHPSAASSHPNTTSCPCKPGPCNPRSSARQTPPLRRSPLGVHGRVLEAEVRRQVNDLEVAGQLLDDLLQGINNMPSAFLRKNFIMSLYDGGSFSATSCTGRAEWVKGTVGGGCASRRLCPSASRVNR